MHTHFRVNVLTCSLYPNFKYMYYRSLLIKILVDLLLIQLFQPGTECSSAWWHVIYEELDFLVHIDNCLKAINRRFLPCNNSCQNSRLLWSLNVTLSLIKASNLFQQITSCFFADQLQKRSRDSAFMLMNITYFSETKNATATSYRSNGFTQCGGFSLNGVVSYRKIITICKLSATLVCYIYISRRIEYSYCTDHTLYVHSLIEHMILACKQVVGLRQQGV